MFGKMTFLIALVLPLVLLNSASAQIIWDAGGFDDLWSTAANWSADTLPTAIDPVSIDDPENAHCQIEDGIDVECEPATVY